MGGCMLLRHMADAGDDCELTAAMAVSPAIDVGAIFDYFSG
jgi:predicted alpha/beta-fold hydrolase